MPEDITVEKRDPQFVVSTRFDCTASAVKDHFEKMLPPVAAYVEAHDGEVTGPPFIRYHAVFDDRFFLEVGLPVEEPIEAKAMFESNELPGGHAVVTTHIGPYKKLGETHRRVREWIRESEEFKPAGAAWDFYLDNPEDSDNDNQRTRVVYPVEKTAED